MEPSNPYATIGYLILALGFLWSHPSIAIDMSDISADELDFDLSAGEFTAKGNVNIDSDEITLSADEVQAKVEGTQLLSITATGNPLQLEMKIDDDDDDPQTILASAKRLVFNNEENWIEFVDEAQLQTDVANIHAQSIRIELDSKKIIARKGEDSEQVKITLREEDTP